MRAWLSRSIVGLHGCERQVRCSPQEAGSRAVSPTESSATQAACSTGARQTLAFSRFGVFFFLVSGAADRPIERCKRAPTDRRSTRPPKPLLAHTRRRHEPRISAAFCARRERCAVCGCLSEESSTAWQSKARGSCARALVVRLAWVCRAWRRRFSPLSLNSDQLQERTSRICNCA